ncbi:DUF2795 domain-containing protein [Stigmatella sp. ncwal1]|uniref:DUF2795 domain-containing protein n=1 Tax=Stigmatella ashevillensis TaxID=2995309 RepID=A0ABT5DN17_9BACT|nr:DUF2795 domain-containing protein [Stigmatella ashevillena]MDC0715060.1 DUF2795 domain-containing protein [Stigmatella ashevillena]
MTRARSTAGARGADAGAAPEAAPSPSIRKALEGAVFPLSVEQLVHVARENGAPAPLLTLLSALPRKPFASMEGVECSLVNHMPRSADEGDPSSSS